MSQLFSDTKGAVGMGVAGGLWAALHLKRVDWLAGLELLCAWMCITSNDIQGVTHVQDRLITVTVHKGCFVS